jgi:CheY-like chemotaxis protein
MGSILVHGTLRIFQHCTFQWSETLTGERTYVIEVGHCAACVTELRRAHPTASLAPASPEVQIARGTAPPEAPRSSLGARVIRMPPQRRSSRVGGRILVIDDDPDHVALVTQLLELAGHFVEQAANGKQALDRLARDPLPSLILLDLSMPVMSGWELLAILRNDARLAHIPILVMSASRFHPDTLSAFDAFLEKGARPIEVRAMVDELLARRR